MNMKLFTRSTGYQMLLIVREPIGMTIAMLFVLAAVPLFGTLFGEFETGVEGVLQRNVTAWESIGIVLAASAFFTIPTSFATQRGHGVLKLFRTSPLTRTQFLISFMLANFIFFLFQAIVLAIFNAVLYGLYLPIAFNSFLLLFMGLILGGMGMISLGPLLPMFIKSANAVPPAGMLFFFPNLFLSGLSMDERDFPAWLNALADILPLKHVGNFISAAWQGAPISEVGWLSYLVLLGYFAVFMVISVRFLKWE